MYKKYLNRSKEISKKNTPDILSKFSNFYQDTIYSIFGSPDSLKRTNLLFSAVVDACPREDGKMDFLLLSEKAFKIKPI